MGSVGSGGSCARRSLRDGGSPSRLGWIFEKEAGCKGCHCCVCVWESCPSVDEGGVAAWRKGAGVSRILVRARLVMKV